MKKKKNTIERHFVLLSEIRNHIQSSGRTDIPTFTARTLRRWAESGAIPAHRLGGRWYVDLNELKQAWEEILESEQTEADKANASVVSKFDR